MVDLISMHMEKTEFYIYNKPYKFIKSALNCLLLSLFFFGKISFAQTPTAEKNTVHGFLQQVKEKSLQIKVNENNKKADLVKNERELLLFSYRGFLDSSYFNQDIPPTSPFASTSSKNYQLKLGLQKLWNNGLESSFSYRLTDSNKTFSSRSNLDYKSPGIEVETKFNILQNMVFNRYGHLQERNRYKRESILIEKRIEKKAILVQALLNLAFLLEDKEDLKLQTNLCQKTKKQSGQLAIKRKKRSISKREYLLSLKELNHCQAKTQELSKSFIEKEEEFQATFNLSFDDFKSINAKKIFQEVQSYYSAIEKTQTKIDLDNKDENKLLSTNLKGLKAKNAELSALSKSSLKLNLRGGYEGVDQSFKNAHSDIGNRDYPFIYVGLHLDLPLKNKTAMANLAENSYRLKALEKSKELNQNKIKSRFTSLKKTLAHDMLIHKKYHKNIKLSQSILREGQKDFNNGRLDFFSLTEFNKALIQDQKVLSNHRIQSIIKLVEFLDYYNFFNNYL